MDRLRAKSEQLTGFLEFIIRSINSSLPEPIIRIITPEDPTRRGCQLSLVFERHGKTVFQKLTERGIIVDWREPDVIRAAPVPLYNSFEDVFRFGQLLAEELSELGY